MGVLAKDLYTATKRKEVNIVSKSFGITGDTYKGKVIGYVQIYFLN